MTMPVSVPSDGTLRVDYVPALADPLAPTITELTAVGAQELSAYITGDGWQPTSDQQSVTDERLASTQTFEKPGRKSKSLTIVYVHNPADPTNNEAYITLAEGTIGYIVARWGVPRGQAWAAGDLVDVWPIEAGEQVKNWNGLNSLHTTTQRLFVIGPVVNDAEVAA